MIDPRTGRPRPRPQYQPQQPDMLGTLRQRIDQRGRPGQLAPTQQPTPAPAPAPMQSATQTGGTAPRPTTTQAPGMAPGVAAPLPEQPKLETTTEKMMEDFVRKMLSGQGDTSEEEALIRELGLDAQGQALVDQRASMGRAGFGSSGALAAMEGDIRRKAGQQTAGDILDLRRSEEQRAIENALSGIGADVSLRGQATDEYIAEKAIELLGGDQGSGNGADTVEPGEPGSGADWAGTLWDKINPASTAQRVAGQVGFVPNVEQFVQNATARNLNEGAGFDNPRGPESAEEVGSQPNGTVLVKSDGAYNYYTDDNGKWYKVKHATMSGDY